jgi:DNA-binding NarL/FixJ family response regulator
MADPNLVDGAVMDADDAYARAETEWWHGHIDRAVVAYAEAYRAYLGEARPARAAAAAMALAGSLFLRGDNVVGSGWLSRAQRLVVDLPGSVEHGQMMYMMEVAAALDGPHLDVVVSRARQVQDVGRGHAEPNLVAMGILGEGRALVRQGLVREGMALLDEAMLAALSGELHPGVAGNIYCELMSACHELADIRRMREWTQATSEWCERLPPAVLFTGICRVHRSQVFTVLGAWGQAEREASQVCADLVGIHVASLAEAHYAVGDIRRLRGDLTGAEEAFATAHGLGRDPQPGLALLRLAQGRIEPASASIHAALHAQIHNRLVRARLCAVQVEIALAAGDLQSARKASEELDETAAAFATSGLDAAACQARGAVLLAGGNTAEALPVLRTACQQWHALDAPYDCARVRELLAEAYTALGDADGAARELGTAAAVFDRLGAPVDAKRVAQLRGRSGLPGGLTAREAQVLSLVSVGRSNREVAASLVLSEKTVARHLSNIFTKLGVSSRTAATAYAFEHGLTKQANG